MYLRKLPSGRFRAEYRDRKGERLGQTFPTLREARLWGAEQERLVHRGAHHDPRAARQLLREFVPGWWASRVVEARTAESDRYRLDKHILPTFGDVPLTDITSSAVQAFAKRLTRDGLAPDSTRKNVRLLGVALETAVHDGILTENPCRHIQLPPPAVGKERFLTRAEIDAVAAEMTDPNRAVLITLSLTGMRWGEVAGLPVRRLDCYGVA